MNLISRLQTATGPSRELDAEIALANGWTKHIRTAANNNLDEIHWRSPTGQIRPQPPRYTESIDTALTLTDGRRVKIGSDNDNVAYASYGSARIYEAATPAIALLIAIEQAKEDSK